MEKYKIGYTMGVFDLFHIGHLNILKRAKEKCEYLIVGITTDELCFERKCKYPVIPFEERAEIVKSICYTNEIVPQTTMDKLNAWQQYKFNVIFVGDDWKGSSTWEQHEKDFSEVGVDVIYFPYTSHTSSTLLTEVLKKL